MEKKIRIFTYHNIPNPGASLFAYSLTQLLSKGFQSDNVKIIDYKPFRMELYGFLKKFKINKDIPFYYSKRSNLWSDFIKNNLSLDKKLPPFLSEKKTQLFHDGKQNIFVVGMDTWCIIDGTERLLFPNIYWLPEKMEATKIAYGVSAFHSDLKLIHKNQELITQYLNDFDVIAARDQFTLDLVKKYRTRKGGIISKIPDPTLTYEIQATGVEKKLVSAGINLNKPILGLLLHGEKKISKEIREYYSRKGYQIVALSMYNSEADFNLGYILNPFEWAETFRHFSFCITDRFHGTIFCLKNNTPFISIQKEADIPIEQSKVFDLLSNFDLRQCFANPHSKDFKMKELLNRAIDIENNWDSKYGLGVSDKIAELQKSIADFNQIMNQQIKKGARIQS